MGSRRRLQPPGFLPLALAGFSLMASYGIVRPLARALFSFEARFMLWGMAVTPLLVTLLLWPYGVALSRLGPRRTVIWCTAASALLLALPLLFRHPWLTFFLYVWKDVYVVLLVEQFWSLANSIHSVEGGKRRFGILLFIGGIGAVSGNQLVALLSEPLGAWTVYQGALLLLLPFAWAMGRAYRAAPVRPAAHPAAAKGTSGIGVLARSRYLLAIAVIVGLGQILVGALEVLFTQHVEVAYTAGAAAEAGRNARAAFEGRFWSWVNGSSMALQLLTPVLLGLLSVRLLHLLIPLSHLVAIGAFIVHPSLATAAVAFAWFKVVDYSLFRASKELLYVPLDFDARFRAKMVIDMTVYRSAKGGAGMVLYLLGSATAAFSRILALAAVAAAAVWALFALKIGRDFATLKETGQNEDANVSTGGTPSC